MQKYFKSASKLAVASAATLALAVAGTANAKDTKLRIQTHFSPETLSGQMAAEFIEDITAMSNGEIQVEMFYASSVSSLVTLTVAIKTPTSKWPGCFITMAMRS